MAEKALVLSSGGVDSSTAVALAVEKYGRENVLTLSMYYGQKHDRELRAAADIAKYYQLAHKEMDVSTLFADSDCSLLAGSTQSIPEKSYAEQIRETKGEKPVSTYVPFRNGLFLSTAAVIALENGCSVIYYGAHADDAAGFAYPDCSPEFHESMGRAIYEGSGHQLRLEAPFIHKNKAGVVKEGLRLKVPYELTWSCYEGGDKPCGRCGTCIDRAAAFAANGVEDPALKK